MTRRNRNTHARLAAWLLGAVLATAPTLALAHGPEAKAVKARLAPLSATLDGINAQVQTTVAPQLVVANDSPRTLEIFDQEGRVFLRINEQGVLAAGCGMGTLGSLEHSFVLCAVRLNEVDSGYYVQTCLHLAASRASQICT